jgi:mutator protein MutT
MTRFGLAARGHIAPLPLTWTLSLVRPAVSMNDRVSVAVAVAVVEWDGRFLVGQRPADVPLGGAWEFPGGKIREGETPEEAAVRECLEETGVSVNVSRRLVETSHDYPHGRVVLHFLACRLCSEQPPLPIAPFVWVAREALRHLDFPAGNQRVLELLRA